MVWVVGWPTEGREEGEARFSFFVGGAGFFSQFFFQTYHCLAKMRSDPLDALEDFRDPLEALAKCVKCGKRTLVGCVKSVCVQNAFKMRSECVRYAFENAFRTRGMRSPEQPDFWASLGAFRARLACLSHTSLFFLGTRTQTSAVPGRGWGCYVHCEHVLLLVSILIYDYKHTHTYHISI